MEAMKAGRELDALVAEKVMGWQWAQLDPQIWSFEHPWLNERSLRPIRRSSWTMPADLDLPIHFDTSHIPQYSIDIAVAWLVVEKMNSIKMDTPEGYQLRAKWSFGIHGASIYNCTAEQAAREICLLACRAMGVAI